MKKNKTTTATHNNTRKKKKRKPTALLAIIIALLCTSAQAETDSIPSKKQRQSYIALSGAMGTVLPTNDFVSGQNAIPIYGSGGIKYVFAASKDKVKDMFYGMPYYGIGLSYADYGRKEDLGTPISIYILQGATIAQLNRRLTLNYELNLGISTGWEHYDPFTNPENVAIGSGTNAHAAGTMYLNWSISRHIDLHLGASLTHFSNGTSRQPNSGINKAGTFIEVAYNFNRESIPQRQTREEKDTEFKPYFQHDIQLVITSKNVKNDTINTNLPSMYNEKQFDVYGLNYYLMFNPNRRYRYGAGIDIEYDESRGAKIYRKLHENGHYYNVTELGSFGNRISAGLSARGEIVLPYHSVFMNIGATVLNHNKGTPRLYQVLGIKVNIAPPIYATFGIKAVNFAKAQYLYWSLGYTIDSKKTKWLTRRKTHRK